MAFVTEFHRLETNILARITSTFHNAVLRVQNYRTYRKTMTELNKLSAKDLADIGLNPGTIKSAAFESAYLY
ncbi:MAG TPA: hypothetical protein DD729_07645 [Rhodobacteraceae bacterium]|jgi:uncharacterized protein YjiS (DUF1127 family)|nr:hypothetical protein [Paracoccaceae bacterium]